MSSKWDWIVDLAQAAAQIQYRDWSFDVGLDEDGTPFLQITFVEGGKLQICRKWLLYESMNPSELVRTAWMAILAAEEHEARERFRYKDVRVMTPHVDFDRVAARGGLPVATTEDPR